MYTIKLLLTEISVHTGNICSDIQGAWTSLRSVHTPWMSEQIFPRMDLELLLTEGAVHTRKYLLWCHAVRTERSEVICLGKDWDLFLYFTAVAVSTVFWPNMHWTYLRITLVTATNVCQVSITKISVRAKRSISRVFSLFIVPSPFFVHCPYKDSINLAKAVLTVIFGFCHCF